jgi:broad specificity phosphatase PhoE
MKEVWFIRHAESEANAGFSSSDPMSIPLTERGYKQADEVSKVISKAPSLIVVSPYIRTQQTARPTIARFPKTECEEWNIQEFTFLSPELCKETNSSQRRPMVDEYWKRYDPFYLHGKDAESFADFLNRVHNTYQRVEAIDKDFVLIFGHGQFIRMLLLSMLVKSFKPTSELMEKFTSFNKVFEIQNCGILKIRFDNKEPFTSNNFANYLEN